MKNRIKRLSKHTFMAEEKSHKIIKLIAGPMAEVARGGVNNKMNVLGPAESLSRNYDRALGIFNKIPDELFNNDTNSITEIKRMIGAVQSYKLKTELEKIFGEEDPNKRQQKVSSIKKHLEIINEMISLMRNEKIKLTA
jgi:hypothetical protein